MIYPSIGELTNNYKINRYTLVVATAKCARIITGEYVKQREQAEASMTGNKETDKPLNTMIDRELRDEKAVHVAVNRLNEGLYVIDPEAGDIAAIEAAAAEIQTLNYRQYEDPRLSELTELITKKTAALKD